MKSSPLTSEEQETEGFGVDIAPQQWLALAAGWAARMDVENWTDTLLSGCLTALPTLLAAVVAYVIWLRRPIKPQSRQLQERRRRKLSRGLGKVLWWTWAIYTLAVVVYMAFHFALIVRNPFLPTFWMYVALNLGQALFCGVVASLFSWKVTRRLVADPLVSTP